MRSISLQNKSLLLQTICENNYHKILRLTPHLREIETQTVGQSSDKPDLFLTPLKKGPYTMTLELSHCFDFNVESFFEPALKLRAYFDARSIEVIRDHERPLVNHAIASFAPANDILNYKWKFNYFLDKWLTYCLKNGYHFNIDSPTSQPITQ